MLGAIIGDIVGSRFEWNNIKTKEFEFMNYRCSITDDSIMSLAIAKAILEADAQYKRIETYAVKYMQELGRKYPDAGYGSNFFSWLHEDNPKPYNSFGNGAAMRVSACGFAAKSLEEAQELAVKVTEVSHNHPESIKAAKAVASAIYMAMQGSNMLEIQDYITKNYYKIDFTLDSIRDSYKFDVSCQGSVPQAFAAFFESTSFEDAIRNAISIGGDSDTLGCITGSIAEAFFGVPEKLKTQAMGYLPIEFQEIMNEFENKYGNR